MVRIWGKNGDRHGVGSDGLCECLVDLDGIDREIVQVGQARIACAEIVDRDVVAFLAETKDGVAGDLLTRGIAFGDLNAKIARRNFSSSPSSDPASEGSCCRQDRRRRYSRRFGGWDVREACAEVAQSVTQNQLP